MAEFNTIHWLPKHLARMREWQEICKAYDYLLNQAWQALDDLHANMSIGDLTEAGCEMWESLLGIIPNKTDTLEERRYRIQTWWTQELPYTLPKLNEMLEALCGAGNYDIVMDNRHYRITIKLGLSNQENYSDVESLLERVLPANLIRTILIMFNTHDTLAAFTHTHLATMTHEQLRTEV